MLLPLLDGNWFEALLMYRRLKFPFIPYNIAHWALLSPCPWKAWTHLLCKRWLWCWWVADSQRCSKDAQPETAFCLYWLPARKLQQHNFNFRLKLLKSYGYTPSQLLDTGITATKLKNSKVFQVPDFRNDGVPLKDFQSAFSISQLLYHGCRIRDLLAFPSRLDHLIEEGGKRLSQDLPQEEREEWTKVFIDFKKSTDLGKLCAHCPVESWNDIFSISELLQAGKTLDAFWHVYPFECAEAWGFSVQDAVATAAKCLCVYRKLKEAGKSAQEVLDAINNLEKEEFREVESEAFFLDSAYTLSEKLHAGMAIQVLENGPDAEQFKEAGCTGCQLREAGFDAESMARAGYSCDELRNAGFTLLEVKDAVSTKAMAEAGCTAQEFKEHGITVKLLQEDGCTAAQLRIIGFVASELIGEYTDLQLASAGFAALELQKLGCEIQLQCRGDHRCWFQPGEFESSWHHKCPVAGLFWCQEVETSQFHRQGAQRVSFQAPAIGRTLQYQAAKRSWLLCRT